MYTVSAGSVDAVESELLSALDVAASDEVSDEVSESSEPVLSHDEKPKVNVPIMSIKARIKDKSLFFILYDLLMMIHYIKLYNKIDDLSMFFEID